MNQRNPTKSEGGMSRFLRGEMSGLELVERPFISNISILLTYQCLAACDHCVFRSNMARKETVDIDDARALIEAASRQDPPPGLGFSGGEPFLRLEMMKELGNFAYARGMIWEVISSSAWCDSYAHARKVLSSLRDRGLVTYATSIDRYHTRFISPRKMRDAIVAALDLAIKVCIKTTVEAELLGKEREYLAEVLQLPGETIDQCRLEPMFVVPVGRALTNVNDFLYLDKDMREGCPFSSEIVALSPLGFLYPCCGMVVGEDPKDAELFIQGTLSKKTAEEVAAMLDGLKNDLFFKLLQTHGPYRLVQILKSRNPRLTTRDKYIGNCDVCFEFTRNSAVIRGMQELLTEWGEKIWNTKHRTDGAVRATS